MAEHDEDQSRRSGMMFALAAFGFVLGGVLGPVVMYVGVVGYASLQGVPVTTGAGMLMMVALPVAVGVGALIGAACGAVAGSLAS